MSDGEIYLYGTVGASLWGEEFFTPTTVAQALAGRSGPVTVRINSGGGVATDGQAIHSLLTGYGDDVHVIVDGVAASAASLIAMAGSTITMRAGALMMVHDPAQPWVDARGTEDDHRRVAAQLAVMAAGYARIYAARAGIAPDEARAIMRAETYFDGPGALAAGFATAVDDAPSAAVARFDYGAYRHAPAALRRAGVRVLPRPAATAVLALIAGLPAPAPAPEENATMASKSTTTATAPEDDETVAAAVPAAATEDEDEDAEEEAGGAAGDGDDDEEEDRPETRAVALIDLALAGLTTMEAARDMVARRLTVTQAVAEITAQRRSASPVNRPRPGAPTARITRDERDTRRAGMEAALVARMARDRTVAGPAREFMPLSLAEMAAATLGRPGRVRRGGDENRAIEMAFGPHSTSDLPAVFENALNKRLMAAYAAALPTYRAIAQRIDFVDFRPHPVSNIGDWSRLLPVGEGGEIRSGTVADKKEAVSVVPLALKMHLTRQMIVNDDLGAIDRLVASRGLAVAASEDHYFYAMMLGGAAADGPVLNETGRQVFNTTDATKAAAAAAITPASIAVGEAALMNRRAVSGDAFLAAEPAILLTGTATRFAALQLLAPIQAAQASNANPYVGAFRHVTSPYITGNAWYLFADPQKVPVFMYGYLQGEEGPRARTDEPFGQQGISYSVEIDFGVGAIDYRGGWKNPGA